MDLPRFSSGQIGNLTYAHLNEAFYLLDKLRPLLIAGGENALLGEAMLIARITAVTSATGLMQWVEVVPGAASSSSAAITWNTRTGGRKSNAPTDPNYDPCVSPPSYISEASATTPTTLPVNSVVILRKSKRKEGKSIWLVCGSVGAASLAPESFPARIGANALISATVPGRWKYAWDEVTITDPVNLTWITRLPANGGRFGRLTAVAGASPPALNTVEGNNGNIGGTGIQSATEVAAPILDGTIVQMTMKLGDGSPFPYFVAGPAISVQCTT